MQQKSFYKAFLATTLLMAGLVQAEPVLLTSEIAGVVAKDTPVEFIKDGFKGTEGPIGLPDGNLLFTATRANQIIKITPDNQVSVYLENSNGSNGLALTKDNELVSVQQLKPQVGIIYPEDKKKALVENYEGQQFQRLNDLVLDKKGGIYFTDIGSRKTPENPNPPPSKAALYYITPDGVLKRLANDIERPNGVQLSRDEKVLYVANTAAEYLLAYDIADDGSISNKRDFAKLYGFSLTEKGKPPSSGADGIAIDNDGRVYVATAAGVEVFAEDGKRQGIIPVARKPQNLAFAGADKKTLYIVGRGAAFKVQALTPGFEGRAK